MGGFYHATIHTALGYMRAVSDGNMMVRLDWDQIPPDDADRPDDVSRETIRQLEAYLAGERMLFDLPLRAEGTSRTGQNWLDTMALIPYGRTVTYGEFAAMAGKPQAPRAAGSACARNPIPIIYPCHRVVRSGGALGNYGGGSDHHPTSSANLDRKRYLIELEQRFAQTRSAGRASCDEMGD